MGGRKDVVHCLRNGANTSWLTGSHRGTMWGRISTRYMRRWKELGLRWTGDIMAEGLPSGRTGVGLRCKNGVL